ncbi:MATE family efflux transporter [Nocardia sp. NPDC088792]|uniref:MATE family efflux transporter n=1 Tax=Nocardia sp. NPDC088792 TaxID=3364332 RepID=UPI0038284020
MARLDGGQLTALGVQLAVTQWALVGVSTIYIGLIGGLGVRELAAGGLALMLFDQVRNTCAGLISATENRVAGVLGELDRFGAASESVADTGIEDVLRSSFLIATGSGLLGTMLLVGLGWALRWMSQDLQVVGGARVVLLGLAPGLVPSLWFLVLRQYLVGRQRPRKLMLVALAAVPLNAGLGLMFIHGWGGFPALGLTGFGIAMSVGYTLIFVALWTAVRTDRELGPALPHGPARPTGHSVRTDLRLGTPIALTYGAETGMFSLLATVMGALGPEALAAYTVVSQLMHIAAQAATGLAHGASVLVSHAVARHRSHEARAVAWGALRRATVVPICAGLLYLFWADWIVRLFLHGDTADTVADLARWLLLMAVLLQFFHAGQHLGIALLRGLQATTAGFLLAITGSWAIGIPAAVLLAFPAGFGALGALTGLGLGMAATSALTLRHFFYRFEPSFNGVGPKQLSPAPEWHLP